jgi:hypothetical protein
MHRHDDDMPAPEKGALDQTPEEKAKARERLEDILKSKGRATISTPMGRLEVGRGGETGFEDEDVPEALSQMRDIWAHHGQMGSKHDPMMRLPSVFKEESASEEAALGWEDLPSSGESSYDPGEAIRRARDAFKATLRREGKLRE